MKAFRFSREHEMDDRFGSIPFIKPLLGNHPLLDDKRSSYVCFCEGEVEHARPIAQPEIYRMASPVGWVRGLPAAGFEMCADLPDCVIFVPQDGTE